jgi:hypothetical protein
MQSLNEKTAKQNDYRKTLESGHDCRNDRAMLNIAGMAAIPAVVKITGINYCKQLSGGQYRRKTTA